MKPDLALYKGCALVVWEKYLRTIFALIVPWFLFWAFLHILEWFDGKPADIEDDTSGVDGEEDAEDDADDAHQADDADQADDRGIAAIGHQENPGEVVEIEDEIEPEEVMVDLETETNDGAKQAGNEGGEAGTKHSSRSNTTKDVVHLELLDRPREAFEPPQHFKVDFDASIGQAGQVEEADQDPKSQIYGKPSPVSLKLGSGRLGYIGPSLETAPEDDSQMDTQAYDTSPVEPSLYMNRARQYRTKRTGATNFKIPIDVELMEREKRPLSPESQEHEVKRQKLPPDEVLIPVASPTSLISEESKPLIHQPSTEKRVGSGYVLRTESLTEPVFTMGFLAQEPENMKHRDGKVPQKEDLIPKGPQGEDDEAKIAATTLLDLSRGCPESNTHLNRVKALLREDGERVNGSVIAAATTLVNLSRGEKVAAHSDPDDPTNVVASPRKMDPTLARQTRNTPRERDCAAFMNFMKLDNHKEDELRAKRQREENAAMRERKDAYAKFKEEIKARKE